MRYHQGQCSTISPLARVEGFSILVLEMQLFNGLVVEKLLSLLSMGHLESSRLCARDVTSLQTERSLLVRSALLPHIVTVVLVGVFVRSQLGLGSVGCR